MGFFFILVYFRGFHSIALLSYNDDIFIYSIVGYNFCPTLTWQVRFCRAKLRLEMGLRTRICAKRTYGHLSTIVASRGNFQHRCHQKGRALQTAAWCIGINQSHSIPWPEGTWRLPSLSIGKLQQAGRELGSWVDPLLPFGSHLEQLGWRTESYPSSKGQLQRWSCMLIWAQADLVSVSPNVLDKLRPLPHHRYHIPYPQSQFPMPDPHLSICAGCVGPCLQLPEVALVI